MSIFFLIKDLKREDIETIIKMIKPVTSKEFNETSYEDLNIDKEGGLVILPEKMKVVKTLISTENKKVFLFKFYRHRLNYNL